MRPGGRCVRWNISRAEAGADAAATTGRAGACAMTIGRRLAKREKLVGTREAHCPACRWVPPLFLMPPDDDAPDAQAPATEADHIFRCETCGKVQRRQVVHIVFPGMPEPTVVWR